MQALLRPRQGICSTYVEVFPTPATLRPTRRYLLHVRGGVSEVLRSSAILSPSAPRTWRCFQKRKTEDRMHIICSTYVEVFPRSGSLTRTTRDLLHVRGGVSKVISYLTIPNAICSTYVEVFPNGGTAARKSSNLLHVRGGVSVFLSSSGLATASAPRSWRCFRYGGVPG